MLLSIALILLVGLMAAQLFQWARLPRLLGMLLAGMLLGPYCLNSLDAHLLSISADIRKIALVIILLRAGLSLDMADLKKVGRPALLMCFVPACFEIVGMLLLAPSFLGVSFTEAALMGTVVAAVSPAVVVPKMLQLMKMGYGTQQGIPQMIMAGASVDDVFVIVLFSICIQIAKGGTFAVKQLLDIPLSIGLGLLGGCLIGYLLYVILQHWALPPVPQLLVVLAVAFLLTVAETLLANKGVAFAGLLAIMTMGAVLRHRDIHLASCLAEWSSHLWGGAELFLFVLVGALVNIQYAFKAGFLVILLVLCALLFRSCGVGLCMVGTSFNRLERLFVTVAYLPKATVQAAIGGVPLAMGLIGGERILTVAVVAIMITAPLGAILMERLYRGCLTHSKPADRN